jgi:hypothetical protein
MIAACRRMDEKFIPPALCHAKFIHGNPFRGILKSKLINGTFPVNRIF